MLRPPSRLLLSQGITNSIQQIRDSTSIVRNSWRNGVYSYFLNEQETVEAQHHQEEDMGEEQEAQGDEELSDIAVEEEDSSSGEEEQQEAIYCHQQEAIRHQPQEAPRHHPGWDDTSDSNYEPSSGDSSS